MHVLYYHQHFSTPDGSTGTRSYEAARRLLARGHSVTMVCGAGKFAKTGLTVAFEKGRRDGVVEGIRVIEFDLPYSNYDGFLKRTLTFLKFASRSVLVAFREDYDLVFATTTPLTAGIPGICARWLRGKPFVFEVRDLWPELPKAMGVIRNPVILALMSVLEWVSYRSANACVGLSPGIVEGIQRLGVRKEAISMIPNACDLDLFQKAPEQPLPELAGVQAGDFVAAFTGTHGVANGLDAMLDAAVVLKRMHRSDIKITFVGDGGRKPALIERAHNEGLDNCLFFDPLPKRLLAQWLCRRAEVGLMILDNVPAFYRGTSPNKFFDYIAAGLPVLTNYPGWIAELIRDHELGYVVVPGDPESFARALVKMADSRQELKKMGHQARTLAESEFSRDILVERLVLLLEQTADATTPPASAADAGAG